MRNAAMTRDMRPCPDGAALNIQGENFPCDAMDGMAPRCDSHDGWAHSSRQAKAIWRGSETIRADSEETP